LLESFTFVFLIGLLQTPRSPPSAITTALDMKAASPPGHSKNKSNEIQQNPRAPKTTNPLEKELNRGLNPLNFFSIRWEWLVWLVFGAQKVRKSSAELL